MEFLQCGEIELCQSLLAGWMLRSLRKRVVLLIHVQKIFSWCAAARCAGHAS
jgi:hypothetical protein